MNWGAGVDQGQLQQHGAPACRAGTLRGRRRGRQPRRQEGVQLSGPAQGSRHAQGHGAALGWTCVPAMRRGSS